VSTARTKLARTAVAAVALLGTTTNAWGQGARPAPRVRTVVIDSVAIVDVATGRVAERQRLVIRGDTIVAVESITAPLPATVDQYVNGAGRFAMPGLTDHHVHLDAGMDRQLLQAARGGVTMVQNMAGDNRIVSEYARRVITKSLAGPEIAYVSVMAGPDFFVDPRFRGAGVGFTPGTAPWIQAVTSATDFPTAIAAARGSGAEILKLYAMMDSAVAARAVAEAHKQGLRVVAHGTVFPARPLQLVQGGVDVLTHAPYLSWQGAATVRAQDAFDRRKGPYTTVPADGPVITQLLTAMQRAHTFLEPTLFVFARQADETDVNAWARLVTRRARDLGVSIIAGTDGLIGGDSTALPNVHQELALLVEAGLTPREALASATTVAAKAMKRERTHGALAAGYVADVLLLDANPLADVRNTTRIAQVLLRGRTLR
jgi:imidazolonepropionase-like amidohydrolase